MRPSIYARMCAFGAKNPLSAGEPSDASPYPGDNKEFSLDGRFPS